MQLYALDNGKIISAEQAEKTRDYICLECETLVRLRSGFHRRSHFFHLVNERKCRLNGKSMQHLQVQFYIQSLIPECRLENPFPAIKRIADIFWEEKGIVFEIQCSPISAEEIKERNKDYRSLGCEIVWILHDDRYNKGHFTAAEFYLLNTTHYYTNINTYGEGFIYDQFSIYRKGMRFHRKRALKIEIHRPNYLKEALKPEWHFIENRVAKWPLYFSGDLLDCYLLAKEQELLEESRQLWKDFQDANKEQKPSYIIYLWGKYIVKPYMMLFRILLERCCR